MNCEALVQLLAKWKRTAYVSKSTDGICFIYDEKCEQDDKELGKLSKKLTKELSLVALAIINHDDGVLAYWIYEDGNLLDKYNSAPSYFDDKKKSARQQGGKPEIICGVFNHKEKIAKIESILRHPSSDKGGYIFETERHSDLCRELGINDELATTSFGDIDSNQSVPNDFIEIGHAPASIFRKHVQQARIAKENLKQEGLFINEFTAKDKRPIWAFCYKPLSLVVAWPDHSKLAEKAECSILEAPWNRELVGIDLPISEHAYGICLSPSSDFIAIANAAGKWKAQLISREKRDIIAEIQHSRLVHGLSFNKDSSILYSLGDELIAYSIKDREIISKIELGSYSKCFALHPAERHVAVGFGNSILIVDLERNMVIKKLFCGGMEDHRGIIEKLTDSYSRQSKDMPEEMKERLLKESVRGKEMPFAMKYLNDGSMLYVSTSGGIRGFSWDKILESTDATPSPEFAYSFLDYSEPIEPDKNNPDLSAFIGTTQPYCYDLDVDEERELLLFSNINGSIGYVDLKKKKCGLLLEIPANPYAVRMKLSPDKNIIAITTNLINSMNLSLPQVSGVQLWNYKQLLAKRAL